MAAVEAVRRQKLREKGGDVQGQQDRAGKHRDAVARQPPPHQPPLRGAIEALLRRRHHLDGIRVERRRRDVVRRACDRLPRWHDLGRRARIEPHLVHARRPDCSRMRGSSTASARSDSRTPITVKNAMNIRNEPARNMSWLRSASSSIGPVVGSDMTTDTIAAPEITCGNSEPISEMNGFSAIRSGYFSSTRRGGKPLARAVTTYCLCSSSSRLARNRRIMLAVPAVPMTTTGTHIWAMTEPTLPHDHGLSR